MSISSWRIVGSCWVGSRFRTRADSKAIRMATHCYMPWPTRFWARSGQAIWGDIFLRVRSVGVVQQVVTSSLRLWP